MTGKEWLKELLVKKANELTRLEQEACDNDDRDMANKYTAAWFKLTNRIIML